jgi:hypothetical protein
MIRVRDRLINKIALSMCWKDAYNINCIVARRLHVEKNWRLLIPMAEAALQAVIEFDEKGQASPPVPKRHFKA